MSLNLNVNFAMMSSIGISASGGMGGGVVIENGEESIYLSIHIRIMLEKSSLYT